MVQRNIRAWSARNIVFVLAVLLMPLVACGGDDPVSPGPTVPPGPAQADLLATATGPTSVAVGEAATFQATVTNSGPDTAEGVVLRATVPSGLVAAAVSDGGSQTDNSVAWTIGILADGQSASRTFDLPATAEGPLRIVASANSDTQDPDATNNDGSGAQAAFEAEAMISADVVLSLSGSTSAATGNALDWTVTVRNDGPSMASGIVVSLTLDAILSGLTAQSGGTIVGATVSWPAIESMMVGSSVVFTVSAPAPLIGPLEATGSATAASGDATPGNNNGSSAGQRQRTLITFDPLRTIVGEASGDQFGWLMDVVGDIDGDGASDFVVGAPFSSAGGPDAGRAYVYSGATGIELHRFTGLSGNQMGFAVDGAGDVNADGIPDAVIGGPGSGSGRVVVISGADGTIIHDLSGEVAGDRFGQSVASLADVNLDGFADYLVTAPGHDGGATNSGRVYIVDGATGTFLATMNSATSGGAFGSAVGSIGDLTGDGVSDFAVGAPDATGSGRIYVLSGADASTVFFSIAAPATGASLGQFWLNSPGDVNGDGLADIFAADIEDNSAGAQAGRAYVYSGANGSLLLEISGESAGDQFGIGRGIEDVNGDGVGDLFVAGWLNDEGGQNAGKGYVFSGADGALLRSFVSLTPGENLGFDAISLGDVTGDGLVDYAISGGISASTPGQIHIVAGVALP